MPKRASLRDRDHAAIAESEHLPATPAEPAAPTTAAAIPRSAGDTARISLYVHPDTFQDARAAYVADHDLPNAPGSFALWVAAVVRTHAERTPAQRAQLVETLPAIDRAGVGIHRGVTVPAQTLTIMDAALAADRTEGVRVIGRSAFAYEAVLAAIEAARARSGGTLPVPPARLPKNLV